MLNKANTFSTKEFDSLEYSEVKYYALEKSSVYELRTIQNSTKNNTSDLSRPPPKQSYLSWVSDQTLSNILLLVSGPLLVFSYSYANYNQIHPLQTLFCKFLVQTIVHKTISILTKNHNTPLPNLQLKIISFRAVFAALHTFILIIAQRYIPLTAVLTINASGLVFLYMITQIINKRIINSQKLKGVVCCIFGLVIMIAAQTVYPLLFGANYMQTSQIQYQNTTFLSRLVVCFLLVLWIAISAVSLLFLVVKNNISANKTVQIHSIVGLFMFSILSQTFDYNRQFGKFLQSTFVSGILFCISNYLYIWGLQLSSKKGLSSFLNQLTIIISYLISISCLNERPNPLQYIGTLLMITSLYFILLKQ